MKVVLDTNIFVSGIFWPGASSKILEAWKNERFDLLMSISIHEEIMRVITSFRKELGLDQISFWNKVLIFETIFVLPKEKISIITADPSDNKFLEAAVEGNADYIVSQDKHLLHVKEYHGVPIVTPEGFLLVLNLH